MATTALIMTLATGLVRAGELHDAVQAGDAARVGELLATRADPDEAGPQAGFAPLHLCVYLGQMDLAPALVAAGADVDVRNPMGLSPVDLAVFVGDEAAAIYFIEQGAGLEGAHGQRPLALAAGRGQAGMVRLLLDGGADPDAPDADGETAVLTAAVAGHAEVVRALLERGARTDLTGRHGLTLLQRAVVAGHAQVVELVIAAGADLLAPTPDGATAHDLARRYGHDRVAARLRAAGAPEGSGAVRTAVQPPAAGGAVVWYLANRGWAIRTAGRLLVFDAEDFGMVHPSEPGLANGFLVADELADHDVLGLYTCYHGAPGELSCAHELAGRVRSAAFIHLAADGFRDGPECRYLEPGAQVDVNGVAVRTLDAAAGMPAHAYVLEADGLRLFYQGFVVPDPVAFADEVRRAVAEGGPVDLAFLPIPEPGEDRTAFFALLEILKPGTVCLLDPNRRSELFPAVAAEIEAAGLAQSVFAPRFPGDRLEFGRPR